VEEIMKRLVVTAIGVAAFAAATLGARQLPPYGGVAEYVADLQARRARVLERLAPNSIAIFWSAPERVYSTDVNYEYRQDSTLLYLTGVEQPDTVLVLVPGAQAMREVLFVRAADARRELWNGHVLTPAEAGALSGVKTVYTQTAFDAFMTSVFNGRTSDMVRAGDFAPFFAALQDKTARLSVLGGGATGAGRAGRGGSAAALTFTPPAPEVTAARAFAEQVRDKFPSVSVVNATEIFNGVSGRRGGGAGQAGAAPVAATNGLRAIKTAYEQKVLRHSADLSAEAHIEGMMAARPGRWEYEVESAIEATYLKNGAMSWGYPSIVGSGPNATTLHYEASTRQMNAGDLLLVDAAANFQGITADITRTYPVSGTFTPVQRDIYELVLAAQEAGMAASKVGGTTGDITAACRAVFGPGLLKLGLITDATNSAQIGWWFPHGASHGIGYDVHDPLQVLAVGSAFTIEPGLYIRQDTIDNLPKDAATAAIVAKIQPAVTKYRNIGVRIEDSILITETGLVNLSARAPRTIAEIEKIVGKGR
jgi:Xaa-Pro aminopeptidase